MELRVIALLIGMGIVVAMAVRNWRLIEEALRRGPWNGGAPPTGPAVAADPFGSPFLKIRSKRGRPVSGD
jgi:hypothetical protein